ncbi:hypothetical protein BD410DRAFT_263262 [Rickenella mellea]|uniref:F-box domain-containing protein n=1 Tax=Rickenella mellea TaxID=50990 RepID=A0A4Y7Q6L0_9AGAM|nr:hypothetical protein BD410DRAFT_263262 [Rickenella mellea]
MASTNAKDMMFNMTGVDDLIRLLTRLKSDPDGFQRDWDNVPKPFVQRDRNTHSPFIPQSELLRSLDECKLCMIALEEVGKHVGKRIRFLRRIVTPFLVENGIKTMPDDVLSLVFEAGHRMTYGWEFGEAVSQTSKRFRQVSLRTPLLWTRISGGYSESQIQAFLSRSGQMDLEISTSLPYGLPNAALDVFFESLQGSSDRWSHLDLFENGADVSMGKLGLCHFPRLKSLSCRCLIDLRLWKAPLLTQILGNYANSPTITGLELQLTSFELSIEDVSLDVDGLASTLHSMPNLRHLSLELDCCEGILYDAIPGGLDARDPHSVHIETLRISIQGSTTRDVVAELYDALSYLSASTVEITLSRLTSDNPSAFFYDTSHAFFPYGSTISVVIVDTGNEDSWDEFYVLTEIVQNCKIVHTIHIDNLDAALVPPYSYSYNWKDYSNLQHLKVAYCTGVTASDLEDLVSNLMTAEAGYSFQSLEIIACRRISEGFFLNLCDEFGSRINLKWK